MAALTASSSVANINTINLEATGVRVGSVEIVVGVQDA